MRGPLAAWRGHQPGVKHLVGGSVVREARCRGHAAGIWGRSWNSVKLWRSRDFLTSLEVLHFVYRDSTFAVHPFVLDYVSLFDGHDGVHGADVLVGNKPESARLLGPLVFKNHAVLELSVLRKVLLEIVQGQIVWQSAYEYLLILRIRQINSLNCNGVNLWSLRHWGVEPVEDGGGVGQFFHLILGVQETILSRLKNFLKLLFGNLRL